MCDRCVCRWGCEGGKVLAWLVWLCVPECRLHPPGGTILLATLALETIRGLMGARVYVCLRRALVSADWNEGLIEIECSSRERNSNSGVTIKD